MDWLEMWSLCRWMICATDVSIHHQGRTVLFRRTLLVPPSFHRRWPCIPLRGFRLDSADKGEFFMEH